MPPLSQDDATRRDVRTIVRSSAWSRALAAVLMLYFAYASGRFPLPEGTGPFEIGGRIFIHTLEIGGVAMLLATLYLLTGMVSALLFDAAASVAIGALFCIAAALMMFGGGGGLVCGVYGVFGVLFFMSGVRTGRDWTRLRGSSRTGMGRSQDQLAAASAPSASLASQLREERSRSEDARRTAPDAPSTTQPSGEPTVDAPPVAADPPAIPENEVTGPEGFLASFAPEDDRKDPDHD